MNWNLLRNFNQLLDFGTHSCPHSSTKGTLIYKAYANMSSGVWVLTEKQEGGTGFLPHMNVWVSALKIL